MYEPETTFTGFGDAVIVLTDNDSGYAFGRYTGNSRSETYQIKIENTITGEKHDEWVHKEDIYQNSKENLETVRRIA